MVDKKFTNVRSSSTLFLPKEKSIRPTPYISKHSINSLTPKEQEARKMHRIANFGSGGFGGGGMNTALSSHQSFFSPQMSTDFLELPQSLREKREIYRHFYNTDPIIGQAIDLHTELPLSKIRLGKPRPRSHPEGFKDANDYADYILWFFEQMCEKTKLVQRLYTMVHHYWLDGGAFVFAEDSTVDVPDDVGFDKKKIGVKSVITDDGEAKEEDEIGLIEREDRETQELAHYEKNYKGWDRLIVLPIDQIKITTYSFTDKMRLELIPSDRDRALIEQANSGDPVAQEMVQEFPSEVRQHIEEGKLIPLGTDPDEGSFCYYMAGRRGAGEELGQSIVDRCHLPGTLVLVKRDDIIHQICIEDLDPDTDLILSDAGHWREFEIGARSVDESVTLLTLSKIPGPIGCTKDHKYQVLRGELVVDVLAGDIRPGDYLQVPSIPLSETTSRVDLASFIDGKLSRAADLNMILGWAESLEAPLQMRSAEACEKFGLKPSVLKSLRYALAQLGYEVVVTNSKHLIFPVNSSGIRAPLESVSTSRLFNRWVGLDSSMGYLLGYFLGDGYVSSAPLTESLHLVYSRKVPASVLSYTKLMSLLNSLGPVGEHGGGEQQNLSLSNDPFARWVSSNFGYNCEDKHLPSWVFDAPKEFLFGLLRGFVDSDGDVVHKKDGSISVRLSSSNSCLADQLLLVCLSLGIPASMDKPSKSRWVKQPHGSLVWSKPMHTIHFTHGPTVKKFFDSGFLAKRKDPDVWKDGKSGSRHVFHGDSLYYRVSSTSSAEHKGLVYSLNVSEDHTFYASWGATRNCLRTLMYREKLRQAQTQIASRAMTPKRIVWGEGISELDVMDLREQVDLALVDPDYSIVTNYEIRWEEMGARDRLLDLSSEYEITARDLYTGLGVTESLLSGESMYSGDKLNLEVINTRYLYLREMVQEFVEKYLFKPVARRKGFVEKNAWGGEVVLYPRLSFTRLPLRDSQDTYDALFNLYNKGSIDISLILEMLNIDSEDTRVRLENDLFTVNDATFNEVLRSLYSSAAQNLIDETDVVDRIRETLGLKTKEKTEEDDPGDGRW